MQEEDIKKLTITGTQNRYQIKKLINENKYEKEIKKRSPSEKWTFSEDQYKCENQLKIIIEVLNNNLNHTDEISKIIIQEINKKISSYKQQDKIKKLFNEEKFLTLESVLSKMKESQLKCRYCIKEMNVLYDISREMKQWSVDRIDNDLGHNIDNFHLACLECNLNRRRRTDEKYLFTKQLNIVKQERDTESSGDKK